MKKIALLSIVSLGFIASAISQVTQKQPTSDFQKGLKIYVKDANGNYVRDFDYSPLQNNTYRNSNSGWFRHTTAYDAFNGTAVFSQNGFVSVLFPDSAAAIINSDNSLRRVRFHVVGGAFDPKDALFNNTPFQMSHHNGYNWDSIAWTQFYIRNIDSVDLGLGMQEVVDTLYIQYFVSQGMQFPTFFYNSAPTVTHYYATPNRTTYNKNTLLNSSAFKTDTVLLTRAFKDSISFGVDGASLFGRGLLTNVGRYINRTSSNINNNIVSVLFAYKPMTKYVKGDTVMDYSNSLNIHRKHNMFALRLSAQTGVEVEQKAQYGYGQNNSLISNFEVRYGQTVSIFNTYLPGTVFGSTIFHNIAFHASSDSTLSIEDITADGFGLGSAYPNPTAQATQVVVPFAVNKNMTATVTLSDVTGKVISVASVNAVNGNNEATINVSGLASGVYYYTLDAGGYTSSKKLIIQ